MGKLKHVFEPRITEGEERLLWYAGKMLADAIRAGIKERELIDSLPTAERHLALLLGFAQVDLRVGGHEAAADAFVANGYIWICEYCVPEIVEESLIGGGDQCCLLCGHTFKRSKMKHVLPRNLPERFAQGAIDAGS